MKCKIDSWKHVERDANEEPCFEYYRLTGTHEGRPFDVTVGIETDGRDAEYEQHSGLGMRWDAEDDAERDRWDDLLAAFDKAPGLNEDMAERAKAYFGE